MRHAWWAVLLLAATSAASRGAEPPLSYLITGDPFRAPSREEKADILAALCDGTVEKDSCDTCPGTSVAGGGFSIRRVIFGHFLDARSTDAYVTIFGCEQMHATYSWGFLVTQRDGAWEPGREVLGMNLDHCHRMAFHSGREFLVCEDYSMQSFELAHNVVAIVVNGDEIRYRSLLTAVDTTRLCAEQPSVQKASIERLEFRDINGDGIEDMSFTASFAAMPDSERRRRLCQDVEDRRSKGRRPEPTAGKTYQINYIFDGRRLTLTKESEAAAKLFEWEH